MLKHTNHYGYVNHCQIQYASDGSIFTTMLIYPKVVYPNTIIESNCGVYFRDFLGQLVDDATCPPYPQETHGFGR